MEKKKDGFPNEKAIVIPLENLLRIKENPMTRLLHPTDVATILMPKVTTGNVQKEARSTF